MRILHLTDRAGGRGGAHVHLAGLIAAQIQQGHDVVLAGGTLEAGGRPPCPVVLVPGLEARTRQPVTLDRLLHGQPPDLVHLHTVVNPVVLEWAAGRPAVITVQDHRYFCPGRGKLTRQGSVCREPLGRAVCAPCFEDPAYFEDVLALTAERLEALRALTVVVLSEYMKKELVASGLQAQRVHVVPPFVHGLDEGAEPDGPPCVLFAGRLVAAKGAPEALHAWRLSGVALPLVAAGTGPMREAMEQGGAEVLGWVDHGRMAALYRRARVLVLPSRWQEPFGIAGLEALTLGTPVAAWRSGGVAEWHPGDDTLVEWGDVPALGRAIAAAAGRAATPPPGFEREPLMRRMEAVYAAARERTARRVASTS